MLFFMNLPGILEWRIGKTHDENSAAIIVREVKTFCNLSTANCQETRPADFFCCCIVLLKYLIQVLKWSKYNLKAIKLLFWVHSCSTQDAKVDQGVHLIVSFPTNIVKQSYKKVCYKIIFINNQFIMYLTIFTCFFNDFLQIFQNCRDILIKTVTTLLCSWGKSKSRRIRDKST